MDDETKNGVKNGEATQFNPGNQPSSEAKKAGWARRKQGQLFMDKVAEYLNMTISELEKLEVEMQASKENYTVRDMMALNYVFQAMKPGKYLIHFLDLHVPKARPIDPKDEATEKGPLTKIVMQLVGGLSNEYDPKELDVYASEKFPK